MVKCLGLPDTEQVVVWGSGSKLHHQPRMAVHVCVSYFSLPFQTMRKREDVASVFFACLANCIR